MRTTAGFFDLNSLMVLLSVDLAGSIVLCAPSKTCRHNSRTNYAPFGIFAHTYHVTSAGRRRRIVTTTGSNAMHVQKRELFARGRPVRGFLNQGTTHCVSRIATKLTTTTDTRRWCIIPGMTAGQTCVVLHGKKPVNLSSKGVAL